ncbi:ribosome maturation factor RimM [Haliovirga abyssi]|uniref:Ribosome maturation factor RimM n=1 Tax=Haliovirga abyssi TaxID=2996794 RepID=A0AAU9D3A7_9FUSO|nr:ribosome maturation factor RimM [Haliovirga abyssi]BDU50456.1 ribosome maturation factor RimM [Haliovirga abyssi]
MEGLLNIGKISGTHHLKGEMKASSILNNLEILIGKKLILDNGKGIKKLVTVEKVSRMNTKKITLQVEEIKNKTDALSYIGCDIFVRREYIDDLESDEYFLADVKGMTVITIEGETLGKVDDIMSTAAHDIYIVNVDKGEIMIPDVKEFIKKVDLDSRIMTVKLIEGMRI